MLEGDDRMLGRKEMEIEFSDVGKRMRFVLLFEYVKCVSIDCFFDVNVRLCIIFIIFCSI